MTIRIQTISQTTDTFGQWLSKTNQLITAVNAYAVTVNSNTAVGNAAITGKFSANIVYANNSLFIGSTSSNVIANAGFINIQYSTIANNLINANGSVMGTTAYTRSIMTLGNTTIRGANVTSNAGYFSDSVLVGNTALYRNYANTYLMNVRILTASANAVVGDNQANTLITRNGVIIYSQPYGTYVVNTNIDSVSVSTVDVYANNLHGNLIAPPGQAIEFRSNTHFLGTNNYFDYGLTSNGDINLVNGARLHIITSEPINPQPINSNSAIIIDNNGNNVIQFRTSQTAGQTSGLVFSENNQSAYLVYKHNGPVGSVNDQMQFGTRGSYLFSVGTQNQNDGVALKTNERLYIDVNGITANGALKIANTTDRSYVGFAVPSGAGNFTWTLPNNDGTANFCLATNGSKTLQWRDMVNPQFNSIGVGIAATNKTGEIRAIDNITAFATSDAKFKTNVKNITDAVSKVNQINGVEYDWTDEYIEQYGGEDGYFIRRHDVGVIAQEVEAILPEVVATRDDGSKAVKYERIVALLIEAVKELSAEVEELKKRGN